MRGGYRNADFLLDQIRSIMAFYYPVCIDEEHGGYINQLLDDGTIYDRSTKHLVGTCRFIHNFAVAGRLLRNPAYIEAARHGLDFLKSGHRQPDGSFAWTLDLNTATDTTRHAYGYAFILLASAASHESRIDEAATILEDAWSQLEAHFFESEHGLYVDTIAGGDWEAIDPYRGQNANMHMCEALLCACRATGNRRYLDRAGLIARRICLDMAGQFDGLIWEHFHSDWSPDFSYNRDDPKNLFRPYGFLPGHLLEWAKLLVALNRYAPEDWQLPRARALFELAVNTCWDEENGGMAFSFMPDEGILDHDRYYWVIAEAIAASALLAHHIGHPEYWSWYEKFWIDAERHFIDPEHGGWYRVLDRAGKRYSKEKSPPAKTDYHPLSACADVLALPSISRTR